MDPSRVSGQLRWHREDRQLLHCRGTPLNVHLSLTPLISLIAGILVLLMPKLLNYIVAFYLIAVGLVGLLGLGALRLH
jgi:hypothetical protein